jgi:prepilin-type N-terminal cleavage/methylation domain-containing protein
MQKLNLKASKTLQNAQGFTLIEILVALTIMSIMMLSIYDIVDGNIDIKERVVSEDREYLQVYTALSRIDKDLSLLYSPLYYDSMEKKEGASENSPPTQGKVANTMPENDFFKVVSKRGHPIPLFERNSENEIMFLTSANRRFIEGQKQSRYAWVKYYLEKGEEEDPKDSLRLYRQVINENIYDANLDIDKARKTLLLTGVISLKFLYWEVKTEKWRDKYDFRKQRPPLSIKVILEWNTKATEENEPQKIEQIIRPYWPIFDAEKSDTPAPQKSGTDINL